MRGIFATCILIFLIGISVFLPQIHFPRFPVAEEVHYIHAAQTLIQTGADTNLEHPPLAKQLIALGILCFGDHPLGWRIMSAVFGALTWVGMYLWGLALFRRQKLALWTAFFAITNQWLWCEAHLATLDLFQFAFSSWGCAAFFEILFGKHSRRGQAAILSLSGFFFGLGTACKWSGVIPWLISVGVYLFLHLWIRWRNTSPFPQFRSSLERVSGTDLGLGLGLGIGLGLIPLLSYLLPYSVYIAHQGLFRWLGLQQAMWLDQTRHLASLTSIAPKLIPWYRWPFLLTPQLVTLQMNPKPGQLSVRSLLILGNPVLMWMGMIAVLGAFTQEFYQRLKEPGPKDLVKDSEGITAGLYFAGTYLSWAIIPHESQYYYYFYPAAMTLSLALTWLLQQFQRYEIRIPKISRLRWIIGGSSLGSFLYFLPILSGIPVTPPWLRLWAWVYRGFHLPIP